MPTVGDRIRERREKLGWKQDELARKASISKSFLSDVENGKRNIGADKLLDIARAINLSLDFLMTGEDAEVSESTPNEVQIPKTLAKFASVQGVSFREVLRLEMQNQIVAHRSSVKKGDLEEVDWQKFYEAVKEFL